MVGEDENSPEPIINVHRSIMCARSPVFHAMLSYEGGMCETKEGKVRIRDVEPDVMKALCAFIYTERCPQAVLAINADRILRAAVKYQILGNIVLCSY